LECIDVACSYPRTAGLLKLQGYWNCRAIETAGLLKLQGYWNCRATGTCVMTTMKTHTTTGYGCQLSHSDRNGNRYTHRLQCCVGTLVAVMCS